VQFAWDTNKDELNQKKHGLSFEEAKALFTSGVEFLEIYDEEHSEDEDRFIAIGPIGIGVIVVIYTERSDEMIRIISARNATAKEAMLYQEHYGDTDE
jgi:uncharacterized DUF497 family protein